MMIIYHKCKSLLYHVVVARKSWDTKSLSHERENTRPLWRVCLGLSYVIDIQRSKIIFTMTSHLLKNRTFYRICIKEFLSKAFLYFGMELFLWMKEYSDKGIFKYFRIVVCFLVNLDYDASIIISLLQSGLVTHLELCITKIFFK